MRTLNRLTSCQSLFFLPVWFRFLIDHVSLTRLWVAARSLKAFNYTKIETNRAYMGESILP